jgi:hypothetical protein
VTSGIVNAGLMLANEALAGQLPQAEEAEVAQEAWQTEGLLLIMDDGRALDASYVTRLFHRLRKRPGEELPR